MLVAIDTATDQASIALHDGFELRAEHTWGSPRRHTVERTPRLVAAMESVSVAPRQIKGIAVTRGPGSFTGLRIGMSVAKGLTLAYGIPLIGIPTLDVIASAQGHDRRPLCAVLQAGRGRICVATYRWRFGEWRVREEPRLATWEQVVDEISHPTLFCGEVDRAGAKALSGLGDQAVLLPAANRLRRAGFLAELAWKRLRQGEIDDPATLAPIYLQHPV